MPTLYNLRLAAPGHYQMAKFDDDFNVAAVYDLTSRGAGFACTCPAGQRTVKLKPCKHQRMLPFMLGAVNTNRFYNPENGQWVEPLAPFIIEMADAPQAESTGAGTGRIESNGEHIEELPTAALEAQFMAEADGAKLSDLPPPVTSALTPPTPTSVGRNAGTPIITRRI